MSAQFHSERVVTTRKPHRCDWCGQVIPTGEKAASFSGFFEDFYSGHMHLECACARDECEWVRDDGYCHGEQVRDRRDDDTDAGPEFTAEDYFRRQQRRVN